MNVMNVVMDFSKFQQLISSIPEEGKDTNTSWYTWESVEGMQVKYPKVRLYGDVLQKLLETAPKFSRHSFIKKSTGGRRGRAMKDA